MLGVRASHGAPLIHRPLSQVDKAAVCNTAIPSSNLGEASINRKEMSFMHFIDQKNLDKIEELMLKSDRTIETASLKTVEELGEFISANFGLNSYKKESPEHLQEELVDVIQCIISLYVLVNKEYPFDINKILKEKNIKWENKYINK